MSVSVESELQSVGQVEQLAVEPASARESADEGDRVEGEDVEPDAGDRERGGQLEAEVARRDAASQRKRTSGPTTAPGGRQHAPLDRPRRPRTAA